MISPWRYASLPERRHARSVLMERQDGRCAGCFEVGLTLQLDHDHDTDLIRGLLCAPCNVGEDHGQALAWEGYVAEPPASLPDREAVLASFARRCAEGEGRAMAALHSSWRFDFRRLAEKAMDRKLDEFQQWRFTNPQPVNPEFEEWMAWLTDMQARVEAAVAGAVSIDHSPLAEFGVKEWEAKSMARDIALNIASRLDREDNRRRTALIQDEMAAALPPHVYVEGEHVWNGETRWHDKPCAFPDCGIEKFDPPGSGFKGGDMNARTSRLRSLLAELTALTVQAAA